MQNREPLLKLPSVEIIHWSNQSEESTYVSWIEKVYREVTTVLDNLPQTLKLYFDQRDINPDYPSDGTAYSHDILTLVINSMYYKKPDEIKRQLRQTIFHELFHIRQKFTMADPQRSALESAVYEGYATVFEREYTNSQPLQGDYSQQDTATLIRWYEQIKTIYAEQYFEPSGETFRKWAFYDPETTEQWKIYRTGTWIVDTVLSTRGINILELRNVNAGQVIELFEG